MAAGEFELIERIRARASTRPDVVLGIGDDAALLLPPRRGELLVACVDTFNAGVHFPAEASAFDIGWKALAVNLSDLAAMGARPQWATLALSLPQADSVFVDGLLDGFMALADTHQLALVGGDTTRGPLSLCVQALGAVDPQRALRRSGAHVGDGIYLSGSLGDAAAGLAALQGRLQIAASASLEFLHARLHRPEPRVALGMEMAGCARAAIDISDGLLADLGHLLAASGLGARIELDQLPTSPALRLAVADIAQRLPLQLSGGDDYELLLCGPAELMEISAAYRRGGLTRIGRIEAEPGLRIEQAGLPFAPVDSARGFDHFKRD